MDVHAPPREIKTVYVVCASKKNTIFFYLVTPCVIIIHIALLITRNNWKKIIIWILTFRLREVIKKGAFCSNQIILGLKDITAGWKRKYLAKTSSTEVQHEITALPWRDNISHKRLTIGILRIQDGPRVSIQYWKFRKLYFYFSFFLFLVFF